MIKLRQELDELLDKDLRDKFYFGKSSIRGEGQLTINSKCGDTIVFFPDIVFNKLTKKDLEFIKETVKSRMIKVNKLLKKYIDLDHKYDELYEKLSENNIVLGWKNEDFTSLVKVNDTKLEYTAWFDNDYKIKNVRMIIKNVDEAKKILEDANKKISVVKEYLEILKERDEVRKELSKCDI